MKVRKLIVGLLGFISFGFSVFAITSCSNTNSDSNSSEETVHIHTWNEIKRTESTCTEEGKIYYLCPDCEERKEVIIKDAKGHSEVIDTAVEATCTETGLTEGSHCDVCNEVLIEQVVVNAKGHEWSYICGECGQTNEEYYTKDLKFTLTGDNTYSVTGIGTVTATEIIIPSEYDGLPVTSIGEYAFKGCHSLESIVIPDNVTSIHWLAFSSCDSLKSVTIPLTGISGIPRRNIKTVVITSGTSIGSYAFSGYSSLTSITIPNSVTSIGECAFLGCSSLESITIPDSVTSIGEGAFSQCSSLESITIPDGVTSIGRGAFQACYSLSSITIPSSVTSIGYAAFWECSSLRSITIPNSVTSIGGFAFRNCSSLTSITIPDSVTSIGDEAFGWCTSLTSITIPDSVTSIGYAAFYYCRLLKDVYYTGTEEQWKAIYIDGENDYLKNATIHYN